MSGPRRALAALAFALAPAFAAAQTSEAIDALWSFGDPAASEARFRAELAKAAPGSREALELATQVARAQGLQRRFDAANATLDTVEPKLASSPPRVRVRYLLERGRVLNSAGEPAKAVPLFAEAAELALSDTDPGADYYRIDALHMLGIAAPPRERMSWSQQALGVAERSKDPRARGWRASILNNLGWVVFERGDAATALAYWQRALTVRMQEGDADRIRIAKWTVARGLRAVGRLDEAETIQLALADEGDRAGKPDGYVFEELAEIAAARGDAATAATRAARAYALLARNADFVVNEPKRLARLGELAAGGSSPSSPPRGAGKGSRP